MMAALALCGRPIAHMGDEADVAYVAEIREVCRLAGRPDVAMAYIEREVAVADVLVDMVDAALGFRSPQSKARQMAPFPSLIDDPDEWLNVEADP